MGKLEDRHQYIEVDALKLKPFEFTESEGMKFDDGKPRWSLMKPFAMVMYYVVVNLTHGAEMHSDHNWMHVERERYASAFGRHRNAIDLGEFWDNDKTRKVKCPHWACLITNAMFLFWFDLLEHNKE